MNRTFVESIKQTAIYRLKEGTATSFYWQSGTRVLPNRLGISKDSLLSRVARKGRALQHSIVGQLRGSFTQKEDSPLKKYRPFAVQSSIYEIAEYPLFFGYGTLGTSNKEGKITKDTDKGDLILLQFVSENEVKISYYPKSLQQLYQILEYENE